MDANGQTICLNMIVKNEAPVIERCLASVRPFVTYWVVVDTGSTDGTQDVVRRVMGDLPGELHERPWRDFAHNRTEALDLARRRGDYVMVIDADDALEADPGFRMPILRADSYRLRTTESGIAYERPQIVRSALPWRWRGVLHEFLVCEKAKGTEVLHGLRMCRNHDGAKRRDPDVDRRDAATLEAALRAESDPLLLSRYRFYLAQSYNDAGEKAKAVEHYLARGEMGFWDEERFVSLLRAARLMAELGQPFEAVLATYERASATCPRRAEALHGASKLCAANGRHQEGYEAARRGLDIPVPAEGLFVEPWIYEYGLLDEYAVNAYWAGAYKDCLDACLKLLGGNKLPGDQHDRVSANARFALDKLPEDRKADAARGRPPTVAQGPGAAKLRVVASMTTIPSRIESIRPVIEAVLAQTAPVRHLELNIPLASARTGEAYVVPDWLERMERVVIFRTEDFGPITKIGPTLLRYRNDPQTHIWSVDDDFAYPANQLELLLQAHQPGTPRILTRYGGELKADGTVQWWYGSVEVTMFEGFGGVLYPPGCIGDDFHDYLVTTSAAAVCRKNDDIVLAMYFNRKKTPIYLYNRPSEEVPYMLPGRMPYSSKDALSHGGHTETYKQIFGFINSLPPTPPSPPHVHGGPAIATQRPSGLDAAAVTAAYRAFLGREPEGEALVRWHLANSGSLEALLTRFVRSEEFRLRQTVGGGTLQRSVLDLLDLLRPWEVAGHPKLRVGNQEGDGGYVMVDDFDGVAMAFSAGVGGDVSWDEQIADRGIGVHQFDHTVDGPPVANPRFYFHKSKVGDRQSEDTETIGGMLGRASDCTGRLLLKVDIEGSEWDVLDGTTENELARFDQVIVEFHGLTNAADAQWRSRAHRVLAKLRSAHEVVHVHANNWSPFDVVANVPIPDVLEVTYASRGTYRFEPSPITLPTALDRASCPFRPDIVLSPWTSWRPG